MDEELERISKEIERLEIKCEKLENKYNTNRKIVNIFEVKGIEKLTWKAPCTLNQIISKK